MSNTNSAGSPTDGTTTALTATETNQAQTEVDGKQSDDDELNLAAQVELLEEENRRLRSEYARAKQSQYRRTAIGLAVVGLFSLAIGVAVSDGREVLIALGMTGLFGAVLTRYLTPSQVVAADVGERIYAAMSANTAAIAAQLGLAAKHRYIPGENRVAHLYVPQQTESEVPALDDGPIVVTTESRGLLLEATGALLFEEFQLALAGELASHPEPLAVQLADGLVQQFELADAIDADADQADGRLTFRVTDSAFGDIDRFDHPTVSFLAVGVVAALDKPVTVEVESVTDRADWMVTCRWEPDTSNTSTE